MENILAERRYVQVGLSMKCLLIYLFREVFFILCWLRHLLLLEGYLEETKMPAEKWKTLRKMVYCLRSVVGLCHSRYDGTAVPCYPRIEYIPEEREREEKIISVWITNHEQNVVQKWIKWNGKLIFDTFCCTIQSISNWMANLFQSQNLIQE